MGGAGSACAGPRVAAGAATGDSAGAPRSARGARRNSWGTPVARGPSASTGQQTNVHKLALLLEMLPLGKTAQDRRVPDRPTCIAEIVALPALPPGVGTWGCLLPPPNMRPSMVTKLVAVLNERKGYQPQGAGIELNVCTAQHRRVRLARRGLPLSDAGADRAGRQEQLPSAGLVGRRASEVASPRDRWSLQAAG